MTKTLAAWLLGLTLLGLSPGASAFLGFGGTSWQEEVLVHDGTKIVVERSVERGGRHEIGQKPPIKEQSLRFTLPQNHQRVEWKDDYSEDVGGANFLPMLLDVVDGTPYLVANPMGCLSYNKWGRPNPPYVIFKHDGTTWQRIPLQELPAEVTTPNLIFSMPDIEAEKLGNGLITAEAISKLIRGYQQPHYRSIVREAYKGASGDCTRMIRIKSGWEGLGFFRSRGSREACLKYCQDQAVVQQECPCTELFEVK